MVREHGRDSHRWLSPPQTRTGAGLAHPVLIGESRLRNGPTRFYFFANFEGGSFPTDTPDFSSCRQVRLYCVQGVEAHET